MAFITYEPKGTSESGKTTKWTVRSTQGGDLLGFIERPPKLGRYVFTTTGATFDATCLQEIALFLARESKR
jgi:hypothetical protein